MVKVRSKSRLERAATEHSQAAVFDFLFKRMLLVFIGTGLSDRLVKRGLKKFDELASDGGFHGIHTQKPEDAFFQRF